LRFFGGAGRKRLIFTEMDMHMKRAVLFAVSLCLLVGLPSHLCAQKTPTFDVTGPTIVAFFPPVTDAELRQDPDTNEPLSDFQFYAEQVREPMKKKGIAFHEVYARQFVISIGKSVTTFRPVPIDVGYYFIAPSKKPLIQYGINSDVGLLQTADEYFGSLPK